MPENVKHGSFGASLAEELASVSRLQNFGFNPLSAVLKDVKNGALDACRERRFEHTSA